MKHYSQPKNFKRKSQRDLIDIAPPVQMVKAFEERLPQAELVDDNLTIVAVPTAKKKRKKKAPGKKTPGQ